jgi:hypothetical protein
MQARSFAPLLLAALSMSAVACSADAGDGAAQAQSEIDDSTGHVSFTRNDFGVTFTNDDGDWVIYTDCFGPKKRGGQDLTVGPGYIARLTLKTPAPDGTRTIVDDERPLIGTPGDPVTAGTLSSPGHGGLGAFGWHHARGKAPFAFNYDNAWEITGRFCAEDHGNFGVSKAEVVSEPALDETGAATFAIDVFFTDAFTYPTPLLKVRYRYRILSSVVKAWTVVTQLCNNGECGMENRAPGAAYIKEPKFLSAVVAGGFKRMAIFNDKNEIATNSVSTNGSCLSRSTDPRKATAQCDADSRVRARFDFGTKESGTEGGCLGAPCLNTVMQAYPVDDGDVVPGKAATLWENGTIGPDAWATRSQGREAVATADSPSGDATWTCHGGSTSAEAQRRWEMGSWPKADGTVQAAGVGFHAWEGGTGNYDCEPLTRRFGPTGESFAIRAQYSINEGWKL